MIRSGAVEMGYTLSVACAPTVAAAWLLARAGSEKVLSCKRVIAAEIADLPVRALDCDAKTRETLAAIGVKTVGAALKLPRDGATRANLFSPIQPTRSIAKAWFCSNYGLGSA